jgi:DNA-binding FrmR family transcriptional regulator
VKAQSHTENMLTRLRRIEGQVRGVQRMLEESRECEDVLTQLMAIRSGIEQVGLLMMDVHLERCLLGDLPAGSPQVQALREALRAWVRFGATVPDSGAGGADTGA